MLLMSRYLNYGAAGSAIGHDISHGFDDLGREFDGYGNRRQWWTQSSIKNFNQQTQCFKNQYDSFTAPNGMKVKPRSALLCDKNIYKTMVDTKQLILKFSFCALKIEIIWIAKLHVLYTISWLTFM